MLDHLRQKAAQALASASSVMLSSYGPADIQSSRVASTSHSLTLYVFIPHNSNILLNLEHRPGIAAVTDECDLQGNARVLAPEEIPYGIKLPGSGDDLPQIACGSRSGWGWVVVEIQPARLTLHSPSGQGNLETIDF
jgi:hypothetical protein